MDSAQESDLAPFLEIGAKVKKVSDIDLPLANHDLFIDVKIAYYYSVKASLINSNENIEQNIKEKKMKKMDESEKKEIHNESKEIKNNQVQFLLVLSFVQVLSSSPYSQA